MSYRSEGRPLAHYPETVEMTPARWSDARLVTFGVFMALLPMILVAFPPSGGPALAGAYRWAGWIGIALFGPTSVYLVYRALRRRVVLRLTEDGLFDASSLTAVGFVPWSEIVGVSTSRISRATMIGLHLRDPEAFLATLSWSRRIAARTNLRMFGEAVWINPAGLPDPEAVAALIDVYRRSWEARSQRSPGQGKAWPFNS